MNADCPPREVLVVEDDPKIAQLLQDYLRHEGFAAPVIGDGQLALRRIEAQAPSAVILDVMLPGMDGLSVCQHVRRFCQVPILMLTARVDELDKLQGLSQGADDYVCKPFSPREVVARIHALLRRADGRVLADVSARTMPADTSPWQTDAAAQRIAWQGQWLGLTPVEFRMLSALIGQPGRVFSRAQLLDLLHADLRDVSDRAIDSHIKNLRRKLMQASPQAQCIASVYGQGYRFEAPS